MRIRILLLLSCVLTAACDSDGPIAYGDCPIDRTLWTALGEGTIEVTGENAPCTVQFESVAMLDGDVAGTLPKLPVVSGPEGMWISATYNPGEFAFWTHEGALDRVVTAGTGRGPGEFGQVSDLLVDTIRNRIHVLSGDNRIVTYGFDGTPLDTRTLVAPVLMGSLTEDGDIVTASLGGGGASRALLITDDSVSMIGNEKMLAFGASVTMAGQGAAWSGESIWYQLDVHALDSGRQLSTIVRDVEWFPRLPRNAVMRDAGPLFMIASFSPDQSRVYTRISQVPDVDAPPTPSARPSGGGEVPVQQVDDIARYYDAVVEVFSVSGELIASTRFDDDRATPFPLGGGAPKNYWYRVYDDEARSIEIFRPVLMQRVE
jgi:hypothetical protein